MLRYLIKVSLADHPQVNYLVCRSCTTERGGLSGRPVGLITDDGVVKKSDREVKVKSRRTVCMMRAVRKH